MSDTHDVVIIGAGTAGLTAGLYAARAGLKALLLEKLFPGGQIVNADRIENFPGFPDGITGADLAKALETQAAKHGVECTYGDVLGLDIQARPMAVRTEDDVFQARAVIIATGSEHAMLGVPGEREYKGRGVSTCATCDGAFFKGKEVAVIGGGDSALDEGLYLASLCGKVNVVHHQSKLQASHVLEQRAMENPRMEFLWDTVVQSINGGEQGVHGMTVRSLRTGERQELPVTGVFVYIGMLPSTQPFRGVVPMDAAGHIKVDLKMATEVPGVFAAGDCRWQSTRQLANCAGDGVTAALAAFEYLQGQG